MSALFSSSVADIETPEEVVPTLSNKNATAALSAMKNKKGALSTYLSGTSTASSGLSSIVAPAETKTLGG